MTIPRTTPRTKRALGLATALAISLATSAALAASHQAGKGSDQSNLVERARITVDDLKRDSEFGTARELIAKAKGVLIVPSLVKGGFFVGGEGGSGVLLTRTADGGWSEPAFYSLGSASFGLQIGVEEAEVVILLMSDKALHSFMSDEVKLGGQAGLAVVTLGATAEAATPTSFKGDIYVWASASGAYAGITLNGSVIKPRESWNAAYYGHPVSPGVIVSAKGPRNPDADALRANLATVK